MAFPVYIHQLTVTDTAVTPQGPLSCGVAGDERAARLRFRLEAADAARYDYRLEAVAGDGTYDLTDWLPLTDGEVLFDIPSRWTAAGIAAVRLVRYVCAEDGIQTARQYYPPVLLQFAYRDDGVQPTDAPLQWQELITRAEAVLDEASEAARLAGEATSVAQQSLEQLQQSTEEAIKTIQDASDQAEGIAVDCADMRDSAQKFADDAENSARLAEEAVDGVKKNCVKPIDWRYKHGSFVISYPDSEEGRPAVAETDYYLSSQNGSDVSDDYIVPTVTEVKGIVSDELRDVETEIDGVKADSVKPSDWRNRYGNFVVSWPNTSGDGRPTLKETDYTISRMNPSAGEDYIVPTVTEVKGIVDAKIDKPKVTPQVGNTLKVTSVNEDGTFVCEWAEETGGVTDVKVKGQSIVDKNGAAAIPVAKENTHGIVIANGNYGIQIGGDGQIIIPQLDNKYISERKTFPRRAITVDNVDYAVKAAMCDGKGAAWSATEQAAARSRMGLSDYELLADVTLEEDASLITVDINKDVKELILFITGAQVTTESNTNILNQDGTKIGGFVSSIIDKTSARIVLVKMQKIDNVKIITDTKAGANIGNLGNGATLNCTSVLDCVDTITQVKIENTGVFVSGMNVKVWGR